MKLLNIVILASIFTSNTIFAAGWQQFYYPDGSLWENSEYQTLVGKSVTGNLTVESILTLEDASGKVHVWLNIPDSTLKVVSVNLGENRTVQTKTGVHPYSSMSGVDAIIQNGGWNVVTGESLLENKNSYGNSVFYGHSAFTGGAYAEQVFSPWMVDTDADGNLPLDYTSNPFNHKLRIITWTDINQLDLSCDITDSSRDQGYLLIQTMTGQAYAHGELYCEPFKSSLNGVSIIDHKVRLPTLADQWAIPRI